MLFINGCVWFVVRWLLCVVRCSLSVVSRLLLVVFGVWCSLVDVGNLLLLVCCSLFMFRCWLIDVCCLVFVV